ncbi:hypothetical protein L208DRAFT_1390531 [Tricholoma matsutake]|nr:hypothetical protein L208DRAFT_1390531 [Tricholoma matsutake 945]
MYCDGTQPDQEKPVTVMVPNPILQAALLKTPQSDRPGGLTICLVDFLDLTQDEDTNSEPEQDDELVDQVIDLTTGMQETGKEEAGELMGNNEIIERKRMQRTQAN